jgi:hypothetical protein
VPELFSVYYLGMSRDEDKPLDIFEDYEEEAQEEPPPKPTLEQAIQERDEAMARASNGASIDEKDLLRDALRTLCEGSVEFTTDEVWFILQSQGAEPPREPRVLGPIVTQAVKQKWMDDTGRMARSKRRHATKMTIYRPLLGR